jgi:hypothetical protein
MDPLARAAADIEERNYGSAIRTLERLTAQDPSNADAFRHLSRVYYHVGDLQKAAEAGQRYVALRPTDASGHHNVGVLLARLGQTAAAESAFRAALSADPGHAKARRALHQLTTAGTLAQPEAHRPGTPPAAPETKAGASPWVARLAAGLTVLASLAILLWLFLPGGPANPGRQTRAPEPDPNQVTTPPAVQPTAPDALPNQTPQPTPQVQPQPESQTQTPAPEPDEQPTGPLPDPKQPSKAVPAARNLWRRVWRTPRRVYWQQPQLQYPGPMAQTQQPSPAAGEAPAPGPSADRGTGTGQEGVAQGPAPQPQAATPQARAQPTQPNPKPQPKAPAQPATPAAPQPLFSPQDAQRVVEDMDRAERQGIQGELGYLANWLRNDPACNDREFWPILQTALATTGPSMAPQGLSIGAGEVMAVITNSETNREAADRLEFYSRNLRSVLPQPVKVQIAQVLGQSTSARQAYNLVDTVLRQSNVATSQQTADVLLEALLRAERVAAQRQAQQAQRR